MSAKWGKADIAPQRLMSANYLKRAHGGTTMRAIVILSITLIGLALVLKNCAGDYYGVPFYCNDAYETGMADGSFDGKKKGREEGREEGRKEGRREGREEGEREGRRAGREEVCRSIENLSRELRRRLSAEGIC